MQPFTERVRLEDDEQILLVVRKHWFILLGQIFVPVLLFVVPVGIYLFAGSSLSYVEVAARLPHKNVAALFFISLWGALTWMMLFLAWTDYYLDVWTITDRRIIAIDQRGFFRRVIASFRYERLQDINVEINGFIPTMLDFGDLHAQTAGHDVDFKVGGISNPRAVKSLILEAADKIMTKRHAELHTTGPQHHHDDGI